MIGPDVFRGGGVGGFVANVTKLGKGGFDDPQHGVGRALRAFVVAPAAIVVALILGASTPGGIILFIVAGIMLVTAVTAFCPAYSVVGISTEPRLHRVGHPLRGGHA